MSIHIGSKIKGVFDNSGMPVSELARRIKTTRQNVYGIFERSSIDTALLERIGEALNYDFFHYYISRPAQASVLEEGSAAYNKKSKRRIFIQIEVDPDKENEILKLALGDQTARLLGKG